MASTDAQKRASVKWQKNNMSRIPVDVSPEYHAYLKEIAAASGLSLRAFILAAVQEKIERDNFKKFTP